MMTGLHQDLIGNLVMFAGLWISARKTPRRMLFWLRIALGFAPSIGPTVGGGLDFAFGWRSFFLVLLVISALMLAAVAIVLLMQVRTEFCAPCLWRHPHNDGERAGEVFLRGESAQGGDAGNRQFGRQQQVPGSFKARLGDGVLDSLV